MVKPIYQANETDLLKFKEKAEEYIRECIELKQIPNLTALRLALGITQDNLTYYRRTKQYKEFYKTFQWYKERVKACTISSLLSQNTPAGHIFILKTHFKMSEQEIKNEKIKLILENKSGLDLTNGK